MTTGTVTMSLADIDALRQQVKDSIAESKRMSEELAEVKADKRTVVITKTRPFNKNEFNVSLDYFALERILRERTERNKSPFAIHDHYGYRQDYGRYVEITPLVKEEESTTYINLDDVKVELGKEIEQKYIDELGKLRYDDKNHRTRLAEIKEEHFKELNKLVKQHVSEKEILAEEREHLTKQYQDDLAKLQKRYDELESGKKEQSMIEQLTEKLTELEAQLQKEKAKKWYNKF